MTKILQKLFCLHKWKSHAIEKYEWTEKKLDLETKHWTNPVWHQTDYSNVVEVLICDHCGKIKIIEY